MTVAEQPIVASVELDPPAIGWHPNIPAETYHRFKGASSTRLNRLRATSAAHVRFETLHPKVQTPPMALGSACHDCILLPERFKAQYTLAPKCDKRTKEGKAEWASFLDSSGGKTPLIEEDMVLCQNMRNAVLGHPMAAKLLSGDGDFELSGLFHDHDTGCLCRIRVDRFATVRTVPLIVDVKTTEDASAAGFAKSVVNFGYHRQAALYLNGAAILGTPAEAFVIIAVEKSPPFAVCVYRIPDELIELGWAQLQPLIEQYARCEREQEWPSYSDQIVTLQAPKWAFNDI